MAVGHIYLPRNTPQSTGLYDAVKKLVDALDELTEHRDTLEQMKDGGVFGPYVLARYGFPDTGTADNALSELNSALGKLLVDTSVSSVHAAIKQLGDKFR